MTYRGCHDLRIEIRLRTDFIVGGFRFYLGAGRRVSDAYRDDLTVSAVVQQQNYLANSFFGGTAAFDAAAVKAATDGTGLRLQVPLVFASQPQDTPVGNSSR
ncbi:hypothetical protein HYN69_02915 [Gemmobacter aquarius]|uniref:Uncharacterized protein n=1 Tax=Paragemmobacter aquarius TaxID=2169400 RepID=A0A2S0UIF3_9RHOB|nr:hypothetical protein HYN69_02915 [Gemmobacter aquarius]